jgi:hypothetical protein
MRPNHLQLANSKTGCRTRCLACGQEELPRGRRRYCSEKCKKRLDFALYIATGLVQTLRARYAAFSYTEEMLVLDILPFGAKVISRFAWQRSNGKKVAEDLLRMVEQAGREWYEKEGKTGSRWWASQHLLDGRMRSDIPVNTVVPVSRKTPQFNYGEKNALRVLELTREQILSEDCVRSIKSAYRRKAKIYHPDKGDRSNKFVKINQAHAELLSWAESPRFCSRAALPHSWCYDAARKRWAPPA